MKGYLIPLALILIAIPTVGNSLDIFGYFEPQLSLVDLHGSALQLESNKLRVDLSSGVGDNVMFAANYDVITYYGTTCWNYLDFLPSLVIDSIPAENHANFNFCYDDRYFLDNAFAKISLKYADITAGKQQISLGTGYAWNPTDLFNIKDILDPTYEQPGHNALRLGIPIGSRTNFMSLYQPENGWSKSGKLLQIKSGLSRFDFSLTATEIQWTFTDYYQFISQSERRKMLGADFVGQLIGLGVWGEFAYNSFERSKDLEELVVGADYTFQSGFYFLGEYHFDSRGETSKDDYNLNDWMQWITGETRSISRHQLFLYASYPAMDLLQVGGSIIAGLSDRSAVLVPTADYSLSENANVTIFGNIYVGEAGSSFSSEAGSGGIVRLRVYF